MSDRIATAEAVRDYLNENALQSSATASLVLRPTRKREDITDLEVLVAPGGGVYTNESKNSSSDEFEIHVGVVSPIDASDEDEIRAMIGYVEEIADSLANKNLDNGAKYARSEYEPLFSEPDLKVGVFFAVVTLTYRLSK